MIKEEIIKKCLGCTNQNIDNTCRVYAFPESKWSAGNCPLATHLKKETKVEKLVNPIKASKRAGKK